MKSQLRLSLLCLLLFPTSSSIAGPVTFLNVDNSDGGAALDGFVTTDLLIDFAGQYTGSQMLLNLTQGSIRLDANGSDKPPSSVLVGFLPSLEFDSFVAQGSATQSGAFGDPNTGGGAVNLGGASSSTFSSTVIDQSWGPGGGNTITDQASFLVARLTLSDDAQGSFRYLSSTGGEISNTQGIVLDGGLTAVPEPSSLLCLALISCVFGGRAYWTKLKR